MESELSECLIDIEHFGEKPERLPKNDIEWLHEKEQQND